MQRPGFHLIGLGLLAATIAGCDSAGRDNLLEIEADATIEGVVFFDVNGTRELEASDRGAGGVTVALVRTGTLDTIARTTTGSGGEFEFAAVPVGRYHVAIPPAVLGDSIGVVYRDPPGAVVEGGSTTVDEHAITVGAEDTATVQVGLGYPRVTLAEARALPPGRKVFVRAVALTQRDQFGDTSLYVRSEDVGIRVTDVQQANVFIGDTLHVLGTTGMARGQPVLDDATVYIMAAGGLPDALDVPAEQVATARGGDYDALLVAVDDLVVTDTATIGAEFVIGADGAPGPVEIVVLPNASYSIEEYAPGAVLDATGVLVPTADGDYWQLRPRSGSDLEVATAAP